jgi:hypothetical protein
MAPPGRRRVDLQRDPGARDATDPGDRVADDRHIKPEVRKDTKAIEIVVDPKSGKPSSRREQLVAGRQ